MMLACLAFAIMNACAKALAGSLPSTEVAFARVAVNLLLILPWMWWRKISFCGASHGLLLLRSLTGSIALNLNFAAAARLPLAELGALVKSSVLFTVLFGMLFLGESRSWKRIFLTMVGFGGVALVLRPSLSMELGGALMALGCAFFASFSALAIRELGSREHPLTVVFHFSAVCALGLLIGFSHTFVWPQSWQWVWLLCCGLAGTIGQILVTQALYRAPASMVAPFSFSEVLFATLLGIMLFGDMLSILTVLGAGVIVYCGIMLARLGTR